MQLTEEQLFAMYGKAVAENVVLRGQLNSQGAELQAALARIEQLEGTCPVPGQVQGILTAEKSGRRPRKSKPDPEAVQEAS